MQTTTQSATPDVRRSADAMQTKPLSPALGAEIIGVDLSEPISDELFAKISGLLAPEISSCCFAISI